MAAPKIKPRGKRGALGDGEEEETRKGRREVLPLPESRKSGGGKAELRRAFAVVWWRNPRGKQRGNGEEVEGFP